KYHSHANQYHGQPVSTSKRHSGLPCVRFLREHHCSPDAYDMGKNFITSLPPMGGDCLRTGDGGNGRSGFYRFKMSTGSLTSCTLNHLARAGCLRATSSYMPQAIFL